MTTHSIPVATPSAVVVRLTESWAARLSSETSQRAARAWCLTRTGRCGTCSVTNPGARGIKGDVNHPRRRLSWTSTPTIRGSTWKTSIIRRAKRIWSPPPRATARRTNWSRGYIPWVVLPSRVRTRSWRSWSLRPLRDDPVAGANSLLLPQEERESGLRQRRDLLRRERHGPDPLRRVYDPDRPELPPRWRPRAPGLRSDLDAQDQPGRGDRRPPSARFRPALAPARRPLRPRSGAQAQQGDPDHLHPPRHLLPRKGRLHPDTRAQDLGVDRRKEGSGEPAPHGGAGHPRTRAARRGAAARDGQHARLRERGSRDPPADVHQWGHPDPPAPAGDTTPLPRRGPRAPASQRDEGARHHGNHGRTAGRRSD